MTDAKLIWILVGCGLALTVVLVVALSGPSDGSGGRYPESIEVPATLEPGWSETGPAAEAPEGEGELVVYLDVSHPMGGFVPPQASESSPAGLSTVAQLLPGYLVRGYGGITRWKTVAEDIRQLVRTPHFDRSLFRGRETFLEPAVEEILEGLQIGRLEAAMLLTDLVATSGPESAMALARPLAPWLRSPAVRAGHFDAGLLGVRSTYWGVHSSSCPARGELGCWYSEQANRYFPLEETIERPFYVLVLGRTDGDPERVQRLGRKLEKELQRLGLDTRWERFSEVRGAREVVLDCSLTKLASENGNRGKQFALVRGDDGAWRCQQDESVEVVCRLKPKEAGSPLPLLGGEVHQPWVQIHLEDGDLHAVVDCARIRSDSQGGELRFENLRAGASPKPPVDWSSWTSFSDQQAEDLRGTLQLALFLEELRMRPPEYRVELAEPLLEVRNGGW